MDNLEEEVLKIVDKRLLEIFNDNIIVNKKESSKELSLSLIFSKIHKLNKMIENNFSKIEIRGFHIEIINEIEQCNLGEFFSYSDKDNGTLKIELISIRVLNN